MERLIVLKPMELGEFLNQSFSFKETKNHLKNENVFVNQKRIKQYHYLLKKNDIVSIIKHTFQFDILYEDKDIIIVDKVRSLPTIAIKKNDTNNLYYQVSSYLKKQNKKNKIFVVHRLDQDTSGIVMFAKSEKVKKILQDNWSNFKRKYIAIVEGNLEKKHDVLKNYLKEDNNHLVHISKDGFLAITEYDVIKQEKNKTWVDIQIYTGKKNQIRVQFKNINHPIIGDKKYGNKDKRLYLHAYLLSFTHPLTQKKIIIKSIIPSEFGNIDL